MLHATIVQSSYPLRRANSPLVVSHHVTNITNKATSGPIKHTSVLAVTATEVRLIWQNVFVAPLFYGMLAANFRQ